MQASPMSSLSLAKTMPRPSRNVRRLALPAFAWRALLDPLTLLLIIGVSEFFPYYPHRTFPFLAPFLGLFGLWAVGQKRLEISMPITTLFLGTWAYNLLESGTLPLPFVMVGFAFLLSYAFWRFFGEPRWADINPLKWTYLAVSTLIVWELALIIQLFWRVEPWSRAFLLVAALIFFQLALSLRFSGETSPRSLIVPFLIVSLLAAIVIATTPVQQL